MYLEKAAQRGPENESFYVNPSGSMYLCSICFGLKGT